MANVVDYSNVYNRGQLESYFAKLSDATIRLIQLKKICMNTKELLGAVDSSIRDIEDAC